MKSLFSEENQVVTIVIIGVLLLLLMGIALLLFFFFSRKKIIEKELEKKSLELNHQKEILQATIVTQEDERIRIAQDLHDDISSKLNVIHLNANLLIDSDLSKDEAIAVNKNIIKITNNTLESARKIAHNLLPPILSKFGLKSAIEELSDDFNNSRQITIDYDIKYPKGHLSPENELHIFRITQELINNSIRHGNAEKSTITISVKDQRIHFIYTDNGIGFDTEAVAQKKGIGMKNIESRIALLNGKLIVKSKENYGTQILITI